MANMAKTKYIVRQPIKDLQGGVLGYEIRYAGEDAGFNGEKMQTEIPASLYQTPEPSSTDSPGFLFLPNNQ